MRSCMISLLNLYSKSLQLSFCIHFSMAITGCSEWSCSSSSQYLHFRMNFAFITRMYLTTTVGQVQGGKCSCSWLQTFSTDFDSI